MARSYYDRRVKPKLSRIPKWRRQGMTEEQVAKVCGVAYSTFRTYKKQHPELQEALDKGREELIEDLEDTLYKKGLGYDYEESELITETRDGVKTTRGRRYFRKALPDTAALIFALKNLAPERWKDKQELDANINTDKLDDILDQLRE